MEKSQKLIMMVDDNEENLKVLGNILMLEGYELAVAHDGTEAIDSIRFAKPDLVIMDVMMPGINGYEVCKKLKANIETKDIPIIFLTAKTQVEDVVKGFECGGVDYITKPFIKQELLARVKTHLKLKCAMDRLKTFAITDNLTGAFNSRFGYGIIRDAMNLSKARNKSFTVCYLDVDNLKTINDRLGHNKGDMLLKKVVQEIKMRIEPTDYICRMGGDEFIIIFQEKSKPESSEIIDTVKQELIDHNIDGYGISFSSGFCEYNMGMKISPEEIIELADKEMYKQKGNKLRHIDDIYRREALKI